MLIWCVISSIALIYLLGWALTLSSEKKDLAGLLELEKSLSDSRLKFAGEKTGGLRKTIAELTSENLSLGKTIKQLSAQVEMQTKLKTSWEEAALSHAEQLKKLQGQYAELSEAGIENLQQFALNKAKTVESFRDMLVLLRAGLEESKRRILDSVSALAQNADAKRPKTWRPFAKDIAEAISFEMRAWEIEPDRITEKILNEKGGVEQGNESPHTSHPAPVAD